MEDAEQELSFNKLWEVYKEKVALQFEELEYIRKQYLEQFKKEFITIEFIFLLFVIISCICASLNGNIESNYLIITIFLMILFNLSIFISKNWREFKSYVKYKNLSKNKILPELMGFFNGTIRKCNEHIANNKIPDFETYKVESGISKYKLQNSGLFLDFDKQYIDDEYVGKYKNVNFKFIETILTKYIEYRLSHTFDWTVFRGVVITFKFNKNIKAHTIVSTKKEFIQKNSFWYFSIVPLLAFYFIFLIYFTITGSDTIGAEMYIGITITFIIVMCVCLLKDIFTGEFTRGIINTLQKITLEYPKFNKRFNVYSNNEVEARYLVTPLFMELLNDLKTAFGTNKLKCSFFDDNFMIAISTNEDLFEIGDLFTPCDDPKFIMRFWRELSSIYKMVEYFRLNKELYPKNT